MVDEPQESRLIVVNDLDTSCSLFLEKYLWEAFHHLDGPGARGGLSFRSNSTPGLSLEVAWGSWGTLRSALPKQNR